METCVISLKPTQEKNRMCQEKKEKKRISFWIQNAKHANVKTSICSMAT